MEFLRSASGPTAWRWLGAILLSILLMNFLNVVNSFVLREFLSAIQGRDWTGFRSFAWMYAAVFAASTAVAVSMRFAEERLGLLWRGWMTRSLTSTYIDGKIYLQSRTAKALTNPDQRISEDVRALTSTTLSLALMTSNSAIAVLSFAGVLWAISPTLFLVSILYALVGSGLTALLGRPLVQLNYQQSDLEADFRGELVQVQHVADAIALAGYEGRSRNRLLERIDRLVVNYRRIIAVNRNVGVFTSGYNYLIQLVPILIVAPLFIRGEAEFGVIGQSTMAFSTLVTALSLIVTQIQSMSAYAAVLRRLGEFANTAARTVEARTAGCVGCAAEADRFVFRRVTLQSPLGDGEVLVRDLDLTIEKGTRLLISGRHAAQQVLFRAAAGMPVVGSGSVLRPPAEKVAYVPENPFFPVATLRDVLISPNDSATTEAEIRAVLKQVGLEGVIPQEDDAKDSVRNWHDLLTLKQEQLFAVARAILARPDFVLLDHLESSLDSANERRVLRLLARRGITSISLSDELPSPELHDRSLELGEGGVWELTDVTPELVAQKEID